MLCKFPRNLANHSKSSARKSFLAKLQDPGKFGVFKNWPSEICRRQSLKNLNHFKIFKGCLSLFKKILYWPLEKAFQFFFSILERISDKSCETCTPCRLIQCCLKVCLLITGQHWLASYFQAWIKTDVRGEFCILSASQIFC